jgi:hypothetical protein
MLASNSRGKFGFFPEMKRSTFSTASNMCRTRVRSSGCILHFGRTDNLVAEIAAQVLRGAQVNPSIRSENRQLGLAAR